MRSIALSEIFSALNLCRRPSRRAVVVLSLASDPHSWGRELLFDVFVAVGLGNLLADPAMLGTMLGYATVIRTSVALSDQTFNKTREIRHHGGCAYPVILDQFCTSASVASASGSGLQLKKR